MEYWETIAKETARRILPILEEWRGARVALSRIELCRRVDCTDSVLRAAIQRLRREGQWIIADDGGYRLAQSADEVHEYITSLREQVTSLGETIEALEDSLHSPLNGTQLEMELGDIL